MQHVVPRRRFNPVWISACHGGTDWKPHCPRSAAQELEKPRRPKPSGVMISRPKSPEPCPFN